MDNRCPKCDSEIRSWRFGLSSLRCHTCQVSLRYNAHDSEQSYASGIELKSVFIGILVLGVFHIFGASPTFELVAAGIAIAALAINEILTMRSRIPKDWRRWKDDSSR